MISIHNTDNKTIQDCFLLWKYPTCSRKYTKGWKRDTKCCSHLIWLSRSLLALIARLCCSRKLSSSSSPCHIHFSPLLLLPKSFGSCISPHRTSTAGCCHRCPSPYRSLLPSGQWQLRFGNLQAWLMSPGSPRFSSEPDGVQFLQLPSLTRLFPASEDTGVSSVLH